MTVLGPMVFSRIERSSSKIAKSVAAHTLRRLVRAMCAVPSGGIGLLVMVWSYALPLAVILDRPLSWFGVWLVRC